jgi:hypothetical protein
VVVSVDVLTNNAAQGLIVIEDATVNDVGFHGVKEGFDEGIVVELPGSFHALEDFEGGQTGAESIG